jgi:hypothetical protein
MQRRAAGLGLVIVVAAAARITWRMVTAHLWAAPLS